ncbi:fatty acyl-CoA reductase wat-like [Neocloeon triangulifer]|uniref:fatty acyl-CoA reductase wat-like n=1 Tax=Neocloeon triangulifer TaxID=2078957 RepID=UPI00286F337A|nr:fatty acyl-CoA reductase wat-like [Neocloeon triangulifer]
MTETKMKSEVADFYNGQAVFITGATGFLGKVLLEKLLRSCPGIESIYILIRAKKNKNVLERTDQLFMDQIYKKLEKTTMSKVMPINGDVSLPGLGISETDRATLTEKVSVVFHSAATVRFVDPLKHTLITNLRGTNEVINLCKEMKHLKSFLYVSTAYSHCVRREIDEIVYDIPMSPEQLLNCCEWMTDDQMEFMAPHIMENWPNPYAYSKALSENLVKKRCENMPAAIFRPSIVVSGAQEPLPGWNDNLNGPTGITAGITMGIIRSMNADKDVNADLVPVDYVVNSMIASAWDVGTNKLPLQVFNFTSGGRNPLTWGRFRELLISVGFDAPPLKALWYFCFFIIKSTRMHNFVVSILHFLPAILLDMVSTLLGKKRRFFRLYQKIDQQTSAPAYFALRQWEFKDDNVLSTIKRMTPEDRKIFRCDIADLDWATYMGDYYLGMRQYVLKDDPSTVPEALKRYKKLHYLHRGLQVVMLIGFLGIALKFFTLIAAGVSSVATSLQF